MYNKKKIVYMQDFMLNTAARCRDENQTFFIISCESIVFLMRM